MMGKDSAWKYSNGSPLAIPDKTSPNPLPASEKKFMELPWSNATTNVCNGDESEEMHENTDEIDALLYSDTEDEASTGHSPPETLSTEEEEVASCLALPAKRKRIDSNHNVGAHDQSVVTAYAEDDAESCCQGVDDQCVEEYYENRETKRAKMERIQETVDMLRKIIPDGRGKDAAAVIDEAISYLRTLRLQALAIEDSRSM